MVVIVAVLAFEAVGLTVCVDSDVEVGVQALSLHGTTRRSEVGHACGVFCKTRKA